ncbi:MAG: hypothetical protein WB678_14230 [Stellaceae bacterium]
MTALRMLWLGCGVALTTLYLAASWTGDIREGWFGAVAAGVIGVGFFTSAWLSNVAWLRWIGLGWWAGELGIVIFPVPMKLMVRYDDGGSSHHRAVATGR